MHSFQVGNVSFYSVSMKPTTWMQLLGLISSVLCAWIRRAWEDLNNAEALMSARNGKYGSSGNFRTQTSLKLETEASASLIEAICSSIVLASKQTSSNWKPIETIFGIHWFQGHGIVGFMPPSSSIPSRASSWKEVLGCWDSFHQ